MNKYINLFYITILSVIILTVIIIYYLKPDNDDNHKSKSESYSTEKLIEVEKTPNEENQEKIVKRIELNKDFKNEASSFFIKIFKNNGGNYETVANMFISNEIKELNLSEDAIQEICNRTIPFVKYETMNALFNSNCKPNDLNASISLINSKILNDNGLPDQKQIIKKLDLYKNNGLLITDIEYKNYNEKTNIYEKSVAMGFTEVMSYLEKNGLHKPNEKLIETQLNGRPSLETINYLIKQGYKIPENSKETFLNNKNNEQKYPDIYKFLKDG